MSRAEVRTDKKVNPAQLKAELGADIFTSEGLIQAEGVTETALQTAVDAHVPDPDFGKPAEDVALKGDLGTKLDQLEADLGDGWDALSAANKQAALRRAGILSIRIARYLKRRV